MRLPLNFPGRWASEPRTDDARQGPNVCPEVSAAPYVARILVKSGTTIVSQTARCSGRGRQVVGRRLRRRLRAPLLVPSLALLFGLALQRRVDETPMDIAVQGDRTVPVRLDLLLTATGSVVFGGVFMFFFAG